ncbi:hypothetical protein HNY73_003071 [Argiope bruennichi]|nr:hypothetical protein HNY73_003071 [Argiope bruennichi]
MKDESRRQDSNEESLTAMHLCMEEEDRKERLITCDRRYSSNFACVGAWEGNIQKCDKFKEKQVAAAICVQKDSSYIVICEYKNLKPTYLCFSRKLTGINDYNLYINFSKIASQMREDIRPCRNKQRRICLERGALFPCDGLDKLESNIDDHDKKFVMHTKAEEKLPNIYMRYESMKNGFGEFPAHSFKQNVSNHTFVYPKKSKTNTELKHETVNLLSLPKHISKFPNHYQISKFSNDYEDISAFETAKDLKDSYLSETESRFRPDMPNVPYSTHGFANQDTTYPKLKNKTVNLLPVQYPISKFENHYEDVSAFETGKDLKDSYLSETESGISTRYAKCPI